MKNLSILGSTGSIGTNALKVIEKFPKRFTVKALAAGKNITLLARQIEQFQPDLAVVADKRLASEIKSILHPRTPVKILYGDEGYWEAATCDSVDMILSAMVGAAGLLPTLAGIDAGKDIALANKETLVMAGEIVMKRALDKNVDIFPVDSEHSAIFQCISGSRITDIKKIILTASGGPFLNRKNEEFIHIKPEDALNHPTWEMGQKISIDSSTLMNKGLEVIEARWLFNISHTMIQVLIHPQSLIHSMVAFQDGGVMAQLSVPDMKGAIAYAFSYPERLPLQQPMPDFAEIGALTFQSPDFEKFPCLALAYEAVETGKTLPAVLNASNEVAVDAFLNRRISFQSIPELIRHTMKKHRPVKNPELESMIQADQWARQETENQIISKYPGP